MADETALTVSGPPAAGRTDAVAIGEGAQPRLVARPSAARGCAARARTVRRSRRRASSPTASSICGSAVADRQRCRSASRSARQQRRDLAAAARARASCRRRSSTCARESRPARRPSSARGAPRAARGGGSPTPVRESAAAAAPARTRPMCHSASSSARCLAATCAAASRCCSVQPPQTPKCGQRGVTRDGLARRMPVGARDLVGRLALRAIVDRHALARQRAFDEHRLAVDARDAAAFLVERGRWRRSARIAT